MYWIKSTLIFFLFTAVLFAGRQSYAQNSNPYDTIKYDSVVIYDYNWNDRMGAYASIIDENRKLAPSVLKSAKLNDRKIAELNALLGEKSSFGNSAAICFIPHLGVVYYKNGKVEGYISICMGCNRLEPNFELPAQNQAKNGEGINFLSGMSKMLRKYLNNLLVENNFSHTIQTRTAYDE